MLTDSPATGREPAALLQATAAFAGAAPSVRNSRPWRWQVNGPVLDLMLDRERVLDPADPHARLAVLSCGAALHHAVVHLAAGGWRAGVQRLPDHRHPDHLARLELAGRIPVDPAAVRLAAVADRRHTDRRAQPGAPLDRARLRPIGLAARRHGADLRVLRPNQIFALAAAFDDAARAQDRPAHTAERTGRAAGPRAIPTQRAAAEQRAAADKRGVGGGGPAGRRGSADRDAARDVDRDVARSGATLIAESHHRAAVFAVLYGPSDDRGDWLRGGEALSAAWLTAAALGLSVLPLRAVIEVATAREAVRRLLERPGRPYLVLRFAAAEPVSPARGVPVERSTGTPGR